MVAPKTSKALLTMLMSLTYSRACNRVRRFTRFSTFTLPATAITWGSAKRRTSSLRLSRAIRLSASTVTMMSPLVKRRPRFRAMAFPPLGRLTTFTPCFLNRWANA